MRDFEEKDLERLFKPPEGSGKGTNGKVVVIGGSSLFHGAPLLSLKVASRVVDMVFFASPEESLKDVCSKIKSLLPSFIWIPWPEVEEYIGKADAILIGPGLLRYHGESNKCKTDKICDETGKKTKKITEELLQKYPEKQWVIDAGSLQTMDSCCIPPKAILTPNRKEMKMLFGGEPSFADGRRPEPMASDEASEGKRSEGGWVSELARKYNCIIVHKNAETTVCSPSEACVVKGGNAGMVKGGTGDVLAGLTVALAAKNDPMLSACAASWIVKKAADQLYEKVGFAYNADDLTEEIPKVLGKYFR